MRTLTPGWNSEDAEYLKAVSIIEKNQVLLTHLLSGEEKLLFLELMEAQRIVNCVTAIENRVSGFQSGMNMDL